MLFNHLILAAWRVVRGTPKLQPEADTGKRNYNLPHLGERETARAPVAMFEHGMETFEVTAARAASGV